MRQAKAGAAQAGRASGNVLGKPLDVDTALDCLWSRKMWYLSSRENYLSVP